MNNKKQFNALEQLSLGLSAKKAAALLGISQRHLWSLNSRGRLPAPVRLGRSVRWNRAELVEWLEAGCPSRHHWEQLKAESAAVGGR